MRKDSKNKYRGRSIYFATLKQWVMIATGGELADFVNDFRRWCKIDEKYTGRENVHGKTMIHDESGNIGMWTLMLNPHYVAHEAVHVAYYMLEARGVKHDDELNAYLVERIVRENFEKLSTLTSKKK